jgi:hypothetical protein
MANPKQPQEEEPVITVSEEVYEWLDQRAKELGVPIEKLASEMLLSRMRELAPTTLGWRGCFSKNSSR